MKKSTWVFIGAIFVCLCGLRLLGTSAPQGASPEQAGAWTAIGPFGGNIRGLVRNPKSPAELYAATESYPGQLWRSTNGGAGWTRQSTISDRPYDLAADPKTPGKLYAISYNSLLISTDQGKTFDSHTLPYGFGCNNGRIAVHPANPKTILVSGDFVWDSANYKTVPAVAKTTNGGTSWTVQKLTSGSEYGTVYDAVFAKSNPNYVYLCGYDHKNSVRTPRIFVSKNSGATWTAVGSSPVFSGDYAVCYAVCVDARDPKKAWVAHSNGIARTANAGGSWKAQQTTQITDVTAIAADASNPKVLYAGGKFQYVRGSLKSTDGGLTWQAVTEGLYGECRRILASGASVYWAGGAGIFQSKNGGTTWAVGHKGIRGAVVESFAAAPSSPNTLIAGIYGYGHFRTANGGALWSPCGYYYGTEFTGSIAISATNPNLVYVKPSG